MNRGVTLLRVLLFLIETPRSTSLVFLLKVLSANFLVCPLQVLLYFVSFVILSINSSCYLLGMCILTVYITDNISALKLAWIALASILGQSDV
jgi:hypothetical protein